MTVSLSQADYRFTLRAAADPATLSRVLDQLALRCLVPDRVQTARRGAELHLELVVNGLEPAVANRLAARFETMVLVKSVQVTAAHLARSA